ncbi:MAG: OadG family protein [Clostridia bacterium]|nr:OadG family protein [Clostridia bacterium]
MSIALQNALLLMLLGMVGIFAVMLLIMAAVNLLNKFAKDKDDKK